MEPLANQIFKRIQPMVLGNKNYTGSLISQKLHKLRDASKINFLDGEEEKGLLEQLENFPEDTIKESFKEINGLCDVVSYNPSMDEKRLAGENLVTLLFGKI